MAVGDIMKAIHQWDVTWSSRLYVGKSPFEREWRLLLKALEYSGHGAPWFALAFYLLLSIGVTSWTVGLMVLLVLDVAVAGSTKFIFQRHRPAYNTNDMIMTVSVDSYSFPSGHTTRAVSLALALPQLMSLSPTMTMFTMVWAIAVSISRVLLGRHHILDVVAGVFFGVLIAEGTAPLTALALSLF
eukprot:m.36087 g.36087  ORF g.36087 m.36087 type:complete len:186 (-) comp9961_c0_seq2:1529-2086(-)